MEGFIELSTKRNRKDDLHFLPEDLIVAEILPRLHIKSLYRFKSVSKRFKSIISRPKFAREYLQRARSSPCSSSGIVSTLLYPITNLDPTNFSKHVKNLSDTVDFIPQYDQTINVFNENELSISVSFVSLPNNQMHTILGSSNGLILSVSRLVLYVSNPLTKQCVALPKTMPKSKSKYSFFGIVGVLLTYKVVLIRKDIRIVEIFSSDTGSWASWEPKHWPEEVFEAKEMTTYKGAFYWLDPRLRMTVIYDPYRDPDLFLYVELPRQSWRRGCLLYSGDEERLKFLNVGKARDGVARVTIWRLVVEKREWCIEDEFSDSGWFPYFSYKWSLFMGDSSRRDVFGRSNMLGNKVVVVNPRRSRGWGLNFLEMFKSRKPTGPHGDHQLVHVELSPWSSPLYSQCKKRK